MRECAGSATTVSATERAGLRGWSGLLLSFGAGGSAALAHPPFGILPGLLGYALLLHVLDATAGARPLRAAFARGWAAGAAYFLVSTWWVGEAFLVDVAAHGWQAPFAVGLLAGGLGLIWGAAGLVYHLIAPARARRVLVFAAVFGLFEWLRGHILTGFPWNLPGESWAAGSAMSQSAAVLGAYGLSVVTLAIAAAPSLLLARDGRRAKAIAVGAAVATLAVMWSGGALRLMRAETRATGVKVRVVQADVAQAAKWDEASFRDIYGRYMRLTAAPAAGRAPDVVIWPESAIPADADAYLAPGTWTRDALVAALRPGQTLLMGAQRSAAGAGAPVYLNSLLALRREAAGLRLVAGYDKHHLVPFGEYLPFRPLLTAIGVSQLAHVEGDFTPGPRPRPIAPPSLPRLQPLICYETLFPDYTPGGADRPQWIVNISNDAWFGRTSGPWQHLNIASYRAIEEGLPIVRATPTGVSAVIDAYGRPLATLGPGRQAVLDAPLPAPAPPPPYTRYRSFAVWVMILTGLSCALRRRLTIAQTGVQGG